MRDPLRRYEFQFEDLKVSTLIEIWNFNYRYRHFYTGVLILASVEGTGVPEENHRLTPSHLELAYLPWPAFEPMQW